MAQLKTIVAQFLSSADMSEHQFMRVWNIAVRGAKEFNMDVIGAFKSVLLDVNDDHTVTLPKDYLSFSKIGILNEVGEVVTLNQNNNLTTLHQAYLKTQMKTVDVPVLNSPSITGSFTTFPFVWLNYWGYGGGGYHLYGVSGGTPVIGEYRIDDANGTIYLSQDWGYKYIMLEYLSDGYDCNLDDYNIDDRASEALVCYIRWKNSQDQKKKFSTADVNYYMRDFYREKSNARRRINSVDVNQFQKEFRSHVKLVAKA